MSRAAGTLITTTNADYIPPYLMPGYHGHCPTIKFDYGDTYGNATSKYFQDYRSSVLNSSQSNYSQGGRFPTYYTHNPDLVMSMRSHTWDQWLHQPNYKLNNTNRGKKDALDKFYQYVQNHREQYKDRSHTLKPVKYFILPTTAENQFLQKHCLYQQPVYIDSEARRKQCTLPGLN